VTKACEASELADRQAIIDEFGEVDRLMKLWKPQVNPHAKRRTELLAVMESWYVDHPAEEGDLIEGALYQVEVKPRKKHRTMTPAAYKKAFERFRKLVALDGKTPVKFDPFTVFSTTLEAIKKHLGKHFLDEIAPEEQTGTRDFIAVAKAPAAAAKAS